MTLDGSRDTWRTPEVEDLCRAFQCLNTTDEIGAFLRDLCTAAELEAMAHRLAAARLLDRGLPYHQVAERVGGSTTTVTRVAQWLRRGEGGYRIVLDRTAPPEPGATRDGRRLVRLALPSKGRLAESAEQLLHDAGIGFTPNGRTLHVHCLDLDLELLFARADDIPRWTADGAVELGITGRNQIIETGVELDELLPSASAAAGSRSRCPTPPRSATSRTSPAGASRPPTRERRLLPWARSASPPSSLSSRDRSSSRLVWAPRTRSSTSSRAARRCARTACARSRACSSRRPCWWRGRDSQATRPRSSRRSRLVLESVLAARPKRYLMLNARDDRLDDVLALLPGLDAPTVLPLARSGMHAVHAVIDADDVVRLLGPLRSAGASSLLVLPIEHLIP